MNTKGGTKSKEQQTKSTTEKNSKKAPRAKMAVRNPYSIDWKSVQNTDLIDQVLQCCSQLKKEKYNSILKFGINQATKSLEQKSCQCLVIVNQYYLESSEDKVQSFLNSHRMNPVEHLFIGCAVQQVPCFILHGKYCSPDQLGQCFSSSQKPVSMTCFSIIKHKEDSQLNEEIQAWIEQCKNIFNSKDYYMHSLPWLQNPSEYQATKVVLVTPMSSNKKRQVTEQNKLTNDNLKKAKHL